MPVARRKWPEIEFDALDAYTKLRIWCLIHGTSVPKLAAELGQSGHAPVIMVATGTKKSAPLKRLLFETTGIEEFGE